MTLLLTPTSLLAVQDVFRLQKPLWCNSDVTYLSVLIFSGALDFEHIEEQAEGIFGGRKVSLQ